MDRFTTPNETLGPTLLGGRRDQSGEPMPAGRRQAVKAPPLPAPEDGKWRIELRYLPILHRGHAFLALVSPNGETRRELHGLAESRYTGHIVPFGSDGSRLVAREEPGESSMSRRSSMIGDVASGSYDQIVRGKWAHGQQARGIIDKGDRDYKSHDLAYEWGGSGGEIQNSNSVAYTLGRAMGLDLDRAIKDAGLGRTLSGWNRDLLDPRYKSYVAPPLFGVKDAP